MGSRIREGSEWDAGSVWMSIVLNFLVIITFILIKDRHSSLPLMDISQFGCFGMPMRFSHSDVWDAQGIHGNVLEDGPELGACCFGGSCG